MTIPFLDILLGLRALFIRDLVRYYYPTKRIIREVILSGQLPMWNPFYSGGQPMAANPEYEVFYPPQWLILLPDYDLGYRLHILVHFWIAALGAYVFFRGLRLTIRASFVGALCWSLGGFFVSTVNLLPIMFCAAWIPAILHFGRRFMVRPNRRDFALSSLLLGIQMLVGEPTTLLQTWSLLGILGLWRSLRHGWRPLAASKALLRVLVIGLGGATIGAAQMIPAADHAGDSIRARGFEFQLVQAWSMTPWRPLEILFPNLFGHVWLDGSLFWGAGLYPGTGSPFYFTIYPGLLIAVFAVAYLVTRGPGTWLGLAIISGSFVVAAGVHTPLLRFLYDVGIFASIRYPEKFSLPALLLIMIFGTIGLDRAIRGHEKTLRIAAMVSAVAVLAAVVASVISLSPHYSSIFRNLWIRKSGRLVEMMEVARLEWLLAVARGFIVLAVLELIRRRRMDGGRFAVVAVLFAADLVWTGRSSLPRVEAEYYTPPALAGELEEPLASYRLFHEADWYGSSTVARRYFSAGKGVYWIVRNGIYPMTPATWGIRTVLERDYDRTALLPTTDLIDAMWRVRDAGQKQWRDIFMSMSNAWYYAQYVEFDDALRGANGRVREATSVQLVPASVRWPRFYFASRVRRAESVDSFVDQLVAGEWIHGTAFVGSDAPLEVGSGTVTHARDGYNSRSIRVRVQPGRNALLVSSTTPHEYWSASIDGRPTEILTVNVGYSGILVPPGEHLVTMEYRNPLVITFSRVAVVSSMLLIVMACMPRRRYRETLA